MPFEQWWQAVLDNSKAALARVFRGCSRARGVLAWILDHGVGRDAAVPTASTLRDHDERADCVDLFDRTYPYFE